MDDLGMRRQVLPRPDRDACPTGCRARAKPILLLAKS